MKLINMFNLQKTKNEACHTLSGFTLIELSIVILISGLLIIPLTQLYSNFLFEKKIVLTKENLAKVSNAVALTSVIRYPCPSDRSLTPNNPNYGKDVCLIPGFTLNSIPLCNILGAEQGICRTPGARDTETDADLVAGNNNEFVLIGGVPLRFDAIDENGNPVVRTYAGLNAGLIKDGWNNQFTYAVSFTSAVSLSGFTRFRNGVIRVVDEWGKDTAGSNKDAQFIIISHGPDGSGSYSETYFRNPCIIANDDGKNCDGDSTFVQGISHYGGIKKYDDYSYSQVDSSAGLWQSVSIPPATANAPPTMTDHITGIPSGKVGIKTKNPGDQRPTSPNPPNDVDIRLDVDGNIKADTVRTQQLCNKSVTACINIDEARGFFGDKKTAATATIPVKNACAKGEVVKLIQNNQVVCEKLSPSAPAIPVLCPPGTWVEQLLANGSFVCTGGIVCPGGTGCTTCQGQPGCPP